MIKNVFFYVSGRLFSFGQTAHFFYFRQFYISIRTIKKEKLKAKQNKKILEGVCFVKKMIIAISVFALFGTQAFAEDRGFVDVFEESAAAGDDIKTFPISVRGEKNSEINGDFNCIGDNICWVEISFYPKHGKLEADGELLTFTYIPDENFTGRDCFYYKVSNGRYTSNVSKCDIRIKNSSADKKLSAFSYGDMDGNQYEYAALRLAEGDVLKGDKIGKSYYFHPEEFVKRSTAAGCVYRILKSASEPSAEGVGAFNGGGDYFKKPGEEVYYARKAGIIHGERCEGKINLRSDEIVSRAEFFCMLDRAMGLKGAGIEPEADDFSQTPDFALSSVKRLSAAGIIGDNTAIRPKLPITKGEMAELLYRYMCYEKNRPEKTASQQISEKLYQEISI